MSKNDQENISSEVNNEKQINSNLIHLENENEFSQLIKGDKVLVDFYADWCGPCKMLAPQIQKVAEQEKNLKIIKVDVDKFKKLAEKYNIKQIPNLFLFKNGEVINTKPGYMMDSEIIKFVNSEK